MLPTGLSRACSAAVEAIAPADAPLLAAIAMSLALTALLALVVPARRAMNVEIVQVLSNE